jgi:hypothetical protein
MKVLISCTENPRIYIEVLDELELFIDKEVIFDEKNSSVGNTTSNPQYTTYSILDKQHLKYVINEIWNTK